MSKSGYKIIKTKNTNIALKIKFIKSFSSYLIYIGSKHRKMIIIDLPFIEIEIHISVNDWMIEQKELLYGKYKTLSKNPKYEKEEYNTFVFPPIKEMGKNGKQ